MVINMVLQLTLVITLLGLASRPFVLKTINSEAVVLITKNYDEQVVDSLDNVLGAPTILHQEVLKPFKKSTLLKSFEKLNGVKLFVVGEGIPYYDLAKVDAGDFHFLPSKNSNGVQSVIPYDPFTVNRKGAISGALNTTANTTLFLRGSEGVFDSVYYSKPGQAPFELRFRPKVTGDFIYQLEQKDSAGTILFSEALPVSVLPERKLNILILQDYPSVELRFLKNYLGEKGHSIAIRYGVSKNIDRSEFVNRESESLGRISTSLLEQFDLVLMSSSNYDNITQSTQRIFQQSITEGLGLVLLVDGDPSNRIKELTSLKFIKTDQDTVRISLDEGSFSFPIAKVRAQSDDHLTSLLSNRENNVEGFVSNGRGKVGFQVLQEVYPLLLSGKEEAYAEVWSPLLEAVSRKESQNHQLKMVTPFPWYTDEPIEIQLIAAASNPVLKLNEIAIPLVEDMRIDGIWTTTVWPTQPGWNQFSIEGDSMKFPFYVSENYACRSLGTVNQIEKNKLYDVSRSSDNIAIKKREDEISPFLFFLVFLFASGALWLLAKV